MMILIDIGGTWKFRVRKEEGKKKFRRDDICQWVGRMGKWGWEERGRELGGLKWEETRFQNKKIKNKNKDYLWQKEREMRRLFKFAVATGRKKKASESKLKKKKRNVSEIALQEHICSRAPELLLCSSPNPPFQGLFGTALHETIWNLYRRALTDAQKWGGGGFFSPFVSSTASKR
jgi:hypothetical protein